MRDYLRLAFEFVLAGANFAVCLSEYYKNTGSFLMYFAGFACAMMCLTIKNHIKLINENNNSGK